MDRLKSIHKRVQNRGVERVQENCFRENVDLSGCTLAHLVRLLPCSKKVLGLNPGLASFCTDCQSVQRVTHLSTNKCWKWASGLIKFIHDVVAVYSVSVHMRMVYMCSRFRLFFGAGYFYSSYLAKVTQDSVEVNERSSSL
ncbi:hypothetical protein XENOCAPTIV_003125 [Xenoophorus captivus]|uniref:Uncharacterized protein n=1 Tax=Xenoophorus captivus TaxID=1517983 RepID=A0ABV0RF80_9TELE